MIIENEKDSENVNTNFKTENDYSADFINSNNNLNTSSDMSHKKASINDRVYTNDNKGGTPSGNNVRYNNVNVNTSNDSKSFENTILEDNKKTNINEINTNKKIVTNKISLTTSMISSDYKVDSKQQKKLDIKLPTKIKSPDYFRLVDNVKKIIETGFADIKTNKVDRSLAQMELALYYLNNIEN